MENDTALKAMSYILEAVQQVTESETGAEMVAGISRQVKDTLKHSRGSQCVQIIGDGMRDVLIDKTSLEMFKGASEHIKEAASMDESVIIVQSGLDLLTLFLEYEKSPVLIDAFSDGLNSVIELPDPKEKIITVFRNLRNIVFFSFTKPWSNKGAAPTV